MATAATTAAAAPPVRDPAPGLVLAGTRLGALDLGQAPLARSARAGHTFAALPLSRPGRTTAAEVVIASVGADEVQMLDQADGTLQVALPFPSPIPTSDDTAPQPITTVALSQPDPETHTVLLFASRGEHVSVWRSHPPGSRRVRRWSPHSSVALPAGSSVTALDAFRTSLFVGLSTGEIRLLFLPPPPAHTWVHHPWRVPPPRGNAPKPIASVRVSSQGTHLAAVLEADCRVLIWSLPPPRNGSFEAIPLNPVFRQRLVLPRVVQRVHWRTPPPVRDPGQEWTSTSRSLAQPVLVLYTRDGTLRFYTPVLDQPDRLALVAAVDRASFTPNTLVPDAPDPTHTGTLYLDAGALAATGAACIQRLHAQLAALELGVAPESASPDKFKAAQGCTLRDTLRTRIKRVEYFTSDTPDVLMRIEHGRLVLRALAGVDRVPPSLVQGYTALVMKLPPPHTPFPDGRDSSPLALLPTAQASFFAQLVPDPSMDDPATAGFFTLGLDGARSGAQIRLDHLFDGDLCGGVLASSDYLPAAPGSAGDIRSILCLPTGVVACAPVEGGIQAAVWTVAKGSGGKPSLMPTLASPPPVIPASRLLQALPLGDKTLLLTNEDVVHIILPNGALGTPLQLSAPVVAACSSDDLSALLALCDGSIQSVRVHEIHDLPKLETTSSLPPLPPEGREGMLASSLALTSMHAVFYAICRSSQDGNCRTVLAAWTSPFSPDADWTQLLRYTLPRPSGLDATTWSHATLTCAPRSHKVAFTVSTANEHALGVSDVHKQHLEDGLELWRPSSEAGLPRWSRDGMLLAVPAVTAVQVWIPTRAGSWSVLAQVDCSSWTARVNAAAWSGNALLVAGASTLRVYAQLLESEQSQRQMPVPLAVAQRAGPLASHHPAFLSSALALGRIDLASLALNNLLHSLRKASGSGAVDTPSLPLSAFWRPREIQSHSTHQTASSALFARPASPSNSSSEPMVWTPGMATELRSLLPSIHLDLSPQEQMALALAGQAVVDVSMVQRSLDPAGLRFLGRLYTVREPGKAGATKPLCFREAVVAFRSKSQEPLLAAVHTVCGPSMSWATAKDTGVFLWLRSGEQLRQLAETVARSEFLRPTIGLRKGAPAGASRDPVGCSLLYFALGEGQEKKVLTLWRQASWHPEQNKMIAFLSKDFSIPRWRAAAAKNAYVLLSQRRFLFAATFFMLAGALKDAVNVCIRQLQDFHLAIALCRLSESREDDTHSRQAITLGSPTGPVLTWLLWMRLIPLSIQRKDRWMLLYALMLLTHPLSAQALSAPWIELSEELEQAMEQAGFQKDREGCDWAAAEWTTTPPLAEHIGAPETQAELLASIPAPQRDLTAQKNFLTYHVDVLCRLGMCPTPLFGLLLDWIIDPSL